MAAGAESSRTAVRTLVFVINPTSGGRHGGRLAVRLAAACPSDAVHHLRGADLPRLIGRLEAAGQPAAVVACGGDGTASAVAGALLAADARHTALAVIPLGTGNDLARVLGWRPLTREADLAPRLALLAEAPERRLDGWRLTGPGVDRAWFNYWSLGADARVAHRFDCLRRRRPWLLRSPAINRAAYALLGAGHHGPRLPVAWHGGRPLPAWAAALVLTSIPSYAGGVRLSRLSDPADGRLEVFALGAQLAMGLVAARLRRPRLLAQPSAWELILQRPAPMQVDGEPFIATPGRFACRHGGTIGVLVAR